MDCNTIALNAPIAELSIAAPEQFAAFKDQQTRKDKHGNFAGQYLDAIRDSPDSANNITAPKKNKKTVVLGRGISKFSRAIDLNIC